MDKTVKDSIYNYGLYYDYNGLELKAEDYPNISVMNKILKNIIKSVDLNNDGGYMPSNSDEHPDISSATTVKEAIEYLDNTIKNINSGSISDINISLSYENGVVKLLYNDNLKSSINIPFEQFLDKEGTKFIESADSTDMSFDSNVKEGLSYLRLAFKTIDNQNRETITYSYIPLNKLSDIYVSSDSSTLGLHISDNTISGEVKISQETNNALSDNNGLFVYDFQNDINSLTSKCDTIEENVNNNTNSISSINSKIETIENVNVTQNEELTNIKETVSNIENNNTTVSTDITDIKGNITNIENNYNNISQEINTVKNDVSNIQEGNKTINETITSIKETISSLPRIDENDNILTISDDNTVISTITLSYSDDVIELKGNEDVLISTIKLRHPKLVSNISFDNIKNVINIEYNDNDTIENQIIDLNGLLVKYNQGNGIIIENNNISVNIDPQTETYLTISENGLKLSGLDEILANIQTSIEDTKKIADESKTLSEEAKTTADNAKSTIDDINTNVNAIESAMNIHADTINGALDRIQAIEERLNNSLSSIIYEYDGVSDDSAVVQDNITVEDGYEILILNRMFKIPDINQWSPVIGYNDGGDNMLLTAIYKLGVSIVVGVSSVERFKNCAYKTFYIKKKITTI